MERRTRRPDFFGMDQKSSHLPERGKVSVPIAVVNLLAYFPNRTTRSQANWLMTTNPSSKANDVTGSFSVRVCDDVEVKGGGYPWPISTNAAQYFGSGYPAAMVVSMA